MPDTMKLPARYADLEPHERKAARQAYAVMQEGLCLYCSAPLDGGASAEARAKSLDMRRFPKNFLKWPLHLHHCHKSGMTLGVVHAHCNGVLWQYHGE